MSQPIAVLGAGAWGTALALRWAGRAPVRLWTRRAETARELASCRVSAYLPGFPLPSAVSISEDAAAVVDGASIVVVATPSDALTQVLQALPADARSRPVVLASKGFVEGREGQPLLAHQWLEREWRAPFAALSGPSFALEVAQGLPTALTVASRDFAFASATARRLRDTTLRLYASDDMTGVEVGGAVKNVLAIAAGLSDGLGLGHNARAALLTRGLAETGRLSLALGGRRETLMGLAGMGDLVLTCTGDLSRNRRVGLALAAGEPLAAALARLGHVAEGVVAAPLVGRLAASCRVEMPICEVVARVLGGALEPAAAVRELLAREPGAEA